MNESNKIFFIINKFSGTGFRADVEGKIIDLCAQAGQECEIQYTQHRGHATELAQEAVRIRCPLVFAMGGDGTVNETARGLIHTPTALGILPKGSGNGLARHLGIPLAFAKAVALVAHHRIETIDTVLINGHLSVNVSGIGFDGHVAGLFGQKSQRGLIGYTRLVLQEYRSFGEFQATLQCDGKEHTRAAWVVALANSSQFGNNARVAPLASVQDQRIDVCVVRKMPLYKAPFFLARLFNGTAHQSRYAEIFSARHISIHTRQAIAFHVDGEPLPSQQTWEVAIQPQSLRVVLPTSVQKKI